MEEAEHCDRIAVIDLGNIIALDTPERLKDIIGGDVIKLKTADDDSAKEELTRKFPDLEMIDDPNASCGFKMQKGDEFIPDLIRDFGTQIVSVNVPPTTLDDVFLKLTGKEIREEGADDKGRLRSSMRQRGGTR